MTSFSAAGSTSDPIFRILCLDGGGAKGVYTIGVLKQFEAYIGTPLHEYFDLIYGTSTGAIIAALLGLGRSMSEIEGLYFNIVPDVMGHSLPSRRTASLRQHAERVFGEQRFDAFLTRVGIVAVHDDGERPMIFKSDVQQALSRKATFSPGFGATIADAVVASAAAYPFFRRAVVKTDTVGEPTVLDGGFAANNPTLFAVADACGPLGQPMSALRILSVGVGHYWEPKRSVLHRALFTLPTVRMVMKVLGISVNTMDGLRRALFPNVCCVRIDDSFPGKQYATDLLEADRSKLRKLFVLGSDSFGRFEAEIQKAFPLQQANTEAE